MEKILIDWLESYTKVQGITVGTKFADLHFDLFDEAMTMTFVLQHFNKKVNPEVWFATVGEMLDNIS
jgi:hypothetical protein